MTVKEQNAAVARRLLLNPFWKEEYRPFIDPDIVIDFFNAPPGMKQHMESFEADCCFEWLGRTVKSWRSEIDEFYGSADNETFWAVGHWGGEVCWGNHDGSPWGRYIMRIVVHNEKLTYVKLMTNSLEMLRAAGREVPIFHMNLKAPEIAEHLKTQLELPAPADLPELDTSPAACKKRKWDALNAFICGTPQVEAPDAAHAVWYLPPEMQESYPPEELPTVEAWTALSMKSWEWDRRGKIFPTDDPRVFFCEYYARGDFRWIGNKESGHYHNTYYYIIKFDEYGRVADCEENLDVMNKFNSINTSLPTFPYYF